MLMMPAWMVSSCFFFSASAEMIVTFTAPLDACISSAVIVVVDGAEKGGKVRGGKVRGEKRHKREDRERSRN